MKKILFLGYKGLLLGGTRGTQHLINNRSTRGYGAREQKPEPSMFLKEEMINPRVPHKVVLMFIYIAVT